MLNSGVMRRNLALFPLETVVFPGASLSLQIFEPRYRELLRDCMAGDRRFGISLIKSGSEVGSGSEPYSVGTIVHISEIGSPRRGAIPITVDAEDRFRIVKLSHVRRYLSAEVDVLADNEEETASEEIAKISFEATKRYLGSILASQGIFKAKPDIPESHLDLSYFMGMIASTASRRDLQTLLEVDKLDDRLQAGVAMLEQEENRMKKMFMRSGPGKERSVFSSN